MKHFKTWLIALSVVAMALVFSSVSVTYASDSAKNGWVQEEGYYYYYEDGTAVTDEWRKIDGSYYYFISDGRMAANTQHWIFDKEAGTDYCYRFDENGKMVTGWYDESDEYDNHSLYYYYPNGHMAEGICEIDGDTYYFDWSMCTDTTTSDGTYLYYFGDDGKLVEKVTYKDGWNKFRGDWFFFENGNPVTGWKTIGNDTYYFYYGGRMAANTEQWIFDEKAGTGYYYRFDENGKMVTGWYDESDEYDNHSLYYYYPNGHMAEGICEIDGDTYYFDWSMRTDVTTSDGTCLYYFGSDGKLAEKTTIKDGWNKFCGAWFFFENGKPVTGWKTIGNDTYYFEYDGRMAANTQHWIFDEEAGTDYLYLFDENGKMVTGWYTEYDSLYYYYPNGHMAQGICKVDGDTYYFDWSMCTDTTTSDGTYLYYFGDDGKLVEKVTSKDGWNKFRGDWFFFENGNPVTGWKTIGNDTYYFYYGGRMAANTEQWIFDEKAGTGYYYRFDENGKMVTGWYDESDEYDNHSLYYYYPNGHMAEGICEIDGDTYYFDWSMRTDTTTSDGTYLYYFGDDGKLVEKVTSKDGWNKFRGDWFFFENGNPVTGWKTIGNDTYYFEYNGRMAANTEQWIFDEEAGTDYYYRFDENGKMVTGWYKEYNSWYYYDKNGHKTIGLQEINGKTYYFGDSGQMCTYSSYADDNYAYYFGEDGYAVEKMTLKTGWNIFIDKWYYHENGITLRNQWKTIGNDTYYFDRNGQMAVNIRQWIYDEETGTDYCYRFDENGKMVTGWYSDKWFSETYYYDQNGREVHGICKIGNDTYYFDYDMKTYCYNTDGSYIYYFGKDGKAVEKKPIQNGWINVKDAWFYGKDGVLFSGEMREIGGKYYYFYSNGQMCTNEDCYYNGNYHYFGSDGAKQTGWIDLGGKYKYFTSDGRVSGLQTIGGKSYYFGRNDGFMAFSEAVTVDGVVYLADVNGVLTKKTSQGWTSGTFYIENGKACTGWKQIGGKWYYFRANGNSVKNEKLYIDGKIYCFNGDGVMQTGWIQKDTSWCYAQSNGVLVQNNWAKIGGLWYYFDYNGYVKTGLQQIDNVWYNLDAATGQLLQTLKNVKNTWVKNGEYWYYLNASGNPASESMTISGKQYMFTSDGRMVTNDWYNGHYYGNDGVLIKNKWINHNTYYYYADSTGKLAYNEWKKIDNVWYYFSGHAMVTGDLIIDGKLYTFRSNGAWTGSSSALATGWKLINGHYFYFENGQKVTGMKTIGGSKYYFYNNSQMAYYTIIPNDNDYYFVQKSGVIATKPGWYSYYDSYVYVGKDGKLVNGLQTIGNKTYYFDGGIMITKSRISEDAKTLYAVASNGVITLKPATTVNGWVKLDNGWYYSNGKTFYTGYKTIDGKLYYFYTDGLMAADEPVDHVYDINVITCMVAGADGVLHSDGWNGRYYLRNRVCFDGPCEMNGKYYYFWAGKSFDGVILIKNVWYYYDGKGSRTKVNLKNGINNIHGNLIYYNAGYPVNYGMININGSYYFTYSDGLIATKFFVGTQYAEADGKLVKGWKKINEYWYYFDNHYNYVTGIQKIDGKQYVFDTHGRMIP